MRKQIHTQQGEQNPWNSEESEALYGFQWELQEHQDSHHTLMLSTWGVGSFGASSCPCSYLPPAEGGERGCMVTPPPSSPSGRFYSHHVKNSPKKSSTPHLSSSRGTPGPGGPNCTPLFSFTQLMHICSAAGASVGTPSLHTPFFIFYARGARAPHGQRETRAEGNISESL